MRHRRSFRVSPLYILFAARLLYSCPAEQDCWSIIPPVYPLYSFVSLLSPNGILRVCKIWFHQHPPLNGTCLLCQGIYRRSSFHISQITQGSPIFLQIPFCLY